MGALGIAPLGIEFDDAACATRAAALHPTLQADVATLDPQAFHPIDLLIASPPCQTFSTAGRGAGRNDSELVMRCARELARGTDTRHLIRPALRDERSLLVVEPLRWALALRSTFLAFEQVPPVLGLWKFFASLLELSGWDAWAGVLNAADYGVPQTRRRAFLLASRIGGVQPPEPTHSRDGAMTLQGAQLRWVTMADALGWGATTSPYATLAGGTGGGPCYDFTGGSGARSKLLTERREGRWAWPQRDPSTTIAGDPRVTARCHHEAGSQGANAKTTGQVRTGDYAGTEPIRLTVAEASRLQGFPSNYPWRGTKTAIHQQIGNAVPPPLARVVINALVGGT